jgi:PQQ-dependent dehydrogenase (methanol/ethanol family)
MVTNPRRAGALVILLSSFSVALHGQSASGEGRELPAMLRRESDAQLAWKTIQGACSQCHSLASVTAARLSQPQWENIVKDMVGRGASLDEQQIPRVVEYLSAAFPASATGTKTGSGKATPFIAVTDAVLQNPASGDWLGWRRDRSASGYSPLAQVNRQNVQKMRLAWSLAMEPGEQENEPIVYRGVMYLPNTHGVVQALDARNGELIWEYRRKLPARLGNDTTRSLAIYQDKIFLTTEDGYLVALVAATGALAWEVKVDDEPRRTHYNTGPIAAEGKVFIGQECGIGSPPPCSVTAHDATTGKVLWRRGSIAGPGDPEEHNATWGGVPYEKRSKSSFWLTGSFDPVLHLLYWTTASASPYPEILKGTGNGSLLYTDSILALDPNTGAIKWFFQMMPRDNFDEDQEDNPILADVQIGGTTRKVVYALGKPGMLWAFDRVTGAYLWNRQLVPFQNIYEDIDQKTGKITVNEKIIPKTMGTIQMVCPGMRGGKLFQTKAFSPQSNAIYSPISNECTMNEVVPLSVNQGGLDYSRIVPMEGSDGNVGSLAAVSASTGEILWKYNQRAAMGSVLATGGGLVFAGDLYRYFRAFDADTGKILWEVPLSGPVTGYPVSYSVDDKQYVAVPVGGNTLGTVSLSQLYPELKSPAGGNVLMVFTVGD